MFQTASFTRLCGLLLTLLVATSVQAEDKPLKILFLGDAGHHLPAARFKQLRPAMAKRGIDVTYTDKVADLNPEALQSYAGLIVYANIDTISADQETALLDYVASGRGFIPLHCASFCFRNSPKYVELVGAQFKSHGTGVFRTTVSAPDHPLMKGFKSFESWDESYVHEKHFEKNRTVLEYRIAEGAKEPWTWVRTHGKGRVFYTAWGHDERTWSNPGFLNLVERGIRWAVGGDVSVVPDFADAPELTHLAIDLKPFEYLDAVIPFYPPSERWGTLAEPLKKMQKPLPAEESLKHYVTPVGFHLELFASDPDLQGKPLCMNWDERGRLWVAESLDYPNELKPRGEGRDRIRICEDTDGDGKADKFTVFADKLSIPTSLLVCRGGVIVHQAPDTLFLKDTNGDDVADERQVLFTGWNTNDTHAGPSNLRYGLDNWIYSIVGYAGFEGTVGGEKHSFRQGFLRFKSDGSKLEFLRNTNNNSWGIGQSEEGIMFGSTANDNPSVYLPIPNRYYESVRGWAPSVLGGIAESSRAYAVTDKVRQMDHHGKFTAGAGHALYTARNYPQDYWNRTAFVTEPTLHSVGTFVIQPDGSDFHSKNSWLLAASNDEWSAPIMAEVGPDGNVWILDWYNFIVQHNPTPNGYKTGKGNAYETDLRDKKHGRVYRLLSGAATKKSGAAPVATLKNATPEQLVAALRSDNMFWRLQAQRLLVERGEKDVVPQLLELVADTSVDGIGLNVGAIHALQTLQGLGVLSGDNEMAAATVMAALKHPSAGVRRNAVQVLPRTQAGANALAAAVLLSDADPQVRLAALLAMADMPVATKASDAMSVALLGSLSELDRWQLDAATSAAARHDAHVLRLSSNLKAGAELRLLERVAEHYARGTPSAEDLLTVVLRLTQEPDQLAILAGLARGWPKNKTLTLDPKAEEYLIELFPKLPPASRSTLLSLATRWGSKKFETYAAEIATTFLTQVKDDKLDEAARLQAAASLIEFRRADTEIPGQLLELLTPRTPPEFARKLLETLGGSEAPPAGAAIVERLEAMTPALRPVAIRLLLSRADWTEALVDALDKGQIQLGELSLDQKQSLVAHASKALAAKAKTILSRGGGLPSADRQKVLDELKPVTERAGDAVAGKVVFAKQCGKCHTHSGEGSKIGPDLTGMAVHPKAELLTHIIDPNRSVEGNYRVYRVALTDGRTLSGLLASESKTSIELFDVEGKKQAIQREDIDELLASTKSLMPEGFEKQVSVDDLCNLLEFLTRRGQYLPIPLAKAATVVTTRGMFFGPEGDVERLIFSDWTPKQVDGIPFLLVDPQGERVANAILLNGPLGNVPPRMPKTVSLPCNSPAKAIHFLSGISGWGFPASEKGTVSMIVRLHYADGKTEDHPLKNGEEFADYIRRVDVPGSKFAFALRGQQIRLLSVIPQRPDAIQSIELVKGPDVTAPVVMAVTVETR